MSDIQITITLPEELIADANEFGVLEAPVIAALLRAETDRRIMAFVNEEIQAYRAEKHQTLTPHQSNNYPPAAFWGGEGVRLAHDPNAGAEQGA